MYHGGNGNCSDCIQEEDYKIFQTAVVEGRAERGRAERGTERGGRAAKK